MLMPKKNRIAIYELLFKEGVMVAKKDVHMPKHPELVDKNVPNLHVMKAMQVWGSRGYVKEQFAWRHFYWYLTTRASSTCGIISTSPPRSSRPRCAGAARRPADPGPSETGMGTGGRFPGASPGSAVPSGGAGGVAMCRICGGFRGSGDVSPSPVAPGGPKPQTGRESPGLRGHGVCPGHGAPHPGATVAKESPGEGVTRRRAGVLGSRALRCLISEHLASRGTPRPRAGLYSPAPKAPRGAEGDTAG
uniref:Plectin/eS10 N-terminal domain-containing protein n=1 Tax=Malurus cyaneus samueli TaxID=2593467 RepID=A0A8C5X018_9PASS